jgi:hypothetical protein
MFKYEIEQIVWYLKDNKPHSAPILSRRYVDHDRSVVNQQDFGSFGRSCIDYETIHAVFPQSKCFENRTELSKWVMGG